MKFFAFKQGDCGRLLSILITAVAVISCCLSITVTTTEASQVDLNSICSGSSLYYCTLTNLTVSLDDPLIWINKSSPAVELNELLIYSSVMIAIPAAIFEIAPKLHSLIIDDCAVNNIRPEVFQNAEQLHKLVIQRNLLSLLPERVFAGCYALEELYLSNNYIHMIHRKAFVRLQHLKYLDLQKNDIPELLDGVFDDLISLEHIDLSFNTIDVINEKTFAKNLKLKTLLLTENKLSRFESNSLMHLKGLHTLDLSYTHVENLQVQSVDVLRVPGSKLKRCVVLGSVVKLNAANNDLNGLTIHDKMSVRQLELHGNRFESLDDIVGMLNLEKLDVSKNQLTSLQTSHSPMCLTLPNLQTLSLASNHLQNLTVNNFIYLVKLKSLDLAFNHLLSLDSTIFEPLIQLEKFYLDGNHLLKFNYEKFRLSHHHLHEMGVFGNDWESHYLKHMTKYLRKEGIILPTRCNHSSDATHFMEPNEAALIRSCALAFQYSSEHIDFLNDTNHAKQFSRHKSPASGVGGIHPYWTSKDVLTVIILIICLLILLLQFFRILKEEQCLPSWCRCCCCIALDLNGEAEPLRHRPLIEDTSTV